jgi:hypothetical protein
VRDGAHSRDVQAVLNILEHVQEQAGFMMNGLTRSGRPLWRVSSVWCRREIDRLQLLNMLNVLERCDMLIRIKNLLNRCSPIRNRIIEIGENQCFIKLSLPPKNVSLAEWLK